ncbi:AQG_2a_G0005360.mRNA.1.CDS.1 [Saccharomyces cerevisiae]|uniref:Protein PBN1 n=3 Tax=Saccharomyces TaxID=4930 RepID=C8Z437_YEAS8|nr:Pbn1p [Saccharomyces cerevisiae YJM993]AJP37388.1 Pbn1p [Saccharomyces cerevisiae YJM1078]AJQ32165.1 Pbn1p [Saccharomyces cerevisiae YJM1383]AJQ32312.1 Pbn1p [Saccharomyces cerevisiae YJM1385]AJQ32605.1 Pbn1p [Saccharomyces cerevisiae YJM1387]AJQ35084.1 Pbn1p [Saccharomyces cerevisiae YJM1450]AJQ35232.1 Pbn1p [Saccharomyces cerevisiae YJM451]AJQ35813.1 Pbn1p [Saccharomyces cerevisiae YJM541]AJQ35961.1 Pbn1p [Saccharomyces cerevisiae YJM554]AJQ36250.1 Pbn1p [Saccharomyces cerevisiae YJM6
MVTRHRVTVLYNAPEDIGNHMRQNDTHLTVRGGSGVVLQQRWLLERTGSLDKSFTRITWRPRADLARSLSVIENELSAGFSVYSNSSDVPERFITNPVYNSFHSEKFDIEQYLPPEVDLNLSWNPEDFTYDISVEPTQIQIVEYRLLKQGEEFTIARVKDEKLEVGVFFVDASDESDVDIGGIRCNWRMDDGKMERCQKTSLLYKQGHIAYNHSTTTTSLYLNEPIGLHPKIMIDLTDFEERPKCMYLMHLQLPLELFIDKFQSSPLLLFGEDDLELPEYSLRDKAWGSESIFELKAGTMNEVTLHTRYIEPSNNKGDKLEVSFDPEVILACDTGDNKVSRNPFYKKGLGYESLFTDDTTFHHLNSTTLLVPIPRPDTKDYSKIKNGTLLCLLISIIYIFSKVFGNNKKKRSVKRE